MDFFISNKLNRAEDVETERQLDAIITRLDEFSADLDHLVLLGSEISGLSMNIDRFL